MLTSQSSNPPSWTQWDPNHPELQRFHHATMVFNDKILLVGGLLRGNPNDERHARAFNLALIDPEKQKFQIIPSIGDHVEELCWAKASVCYWKDSKIVVFGGLDFDHNECKSNVAIVTLQELDSETPFAYWERIQTTSQHCRNGHSAYIYQDKMLVIGGSLNRKKKIDNPWCLDLDNLSWEEIIKPVENLIDGTPIFHKNKVYIVNTLHPNLTITTFDIEARLWDKIIGPEIPDVQAYLVCSQLVEGKIYFLLGRKYDGRWPLAAPWSYDIESQKWTEILASNYPLFGGEARLLFVNSQLMLCGGWVGDNPKYGEIWSLPLSVSKPSQTINKLSSTQQALLDFFKEAPYSDISFEVENEIIPAHKWWLSKRNKFFANMFSSGMSESQASKITITDIKASTFKALLEFLYSDHVDLDNTLAIELLQQADKYSIDQLKTECEKHLIANIGPENYVVLGQTAELIGAVALRDAVVAFMAKNMKTVKPRKDFSEISDALLRDSLVKFTNS